MNGQQAFAVAIESVLVVAFLGLMVMPAQTFGFFGAKLPKASVVWPLGMAAAAWLVYAQRYRPGVEA